MLKSTLRRGSIVIGDHRVTTRSSVNEIKAACRVFALLNPGKQTYSVAQLGISYDSNGDDIVEFCKLLSPRGGRMVIAGQFESLDQLCGLSASQLATDFGITETVITEIKRALKTVNRSLAAK